jgi:hypothetical protein
MPDIGALLYSGVDFNSDQKGTRSAVDETMESVTQTAQSLLQIALWYRGYIYAARIYPSIAIIIFNTFDKGSNNKTIRF